LRLFGLASAIRLVTLTSKDLWSLSESQYFGLQQVRPDPVRDFNDLSGARIVVQTLSQVQTVRRFIEENFRIIETEDIGERVAASQFGYRNRHYIVKLNPELARRIGFTHCEIQAIGERRARGAGTHLGATRVGGHAS
jgi:ppGpp synthetase/RelA/SpoT-type nucleotidyltranferase